MSNSELNMLENIARNNVDATRKRIDGSRTGHEMVKDIGELIKQEVELEIFQAAQNDIKRAEVVIHRYLREGGKTPDPFDHAEITAQREGANRALQFLRGHVDPAIILYGPSVR